jgi:hypothetical protein
MLFQQPLTILGGGRTEEGTQAIGKSRESRS